MLHWEPDCQVLAAGDLRACGGGLDRIGFLREIMADPLKYRCPFCDCEVRVGQPCPGCAKKRKPARQPKRKSWQQDESADGLNLPDDDFDYDEFIAREFGKSPHRELGVKWYWWVLGVALLVILAFLWVF